MGIARDIAPCADGRRKGLHPIQNQNRRRTRSAVALHCSLRRDPGCGGDTALACNESLAARTHAGHGDFMVVHRTTSDVLEQADALPFWTQDYTQLSKGEFAGAVNSVSRCGLQLFCETMNRSVDEAACAPADSYVIGLPTLVEGEASWGLLPIDARSLLTLDKNSELLFRTSTRSELAAAVIPAGCLERYAEQIEGIDLRKAIGSVKPAECMAPEISARLKAVLVEGLKRFGEDPQGEDELAWRHFEDELLATCMQALTRGRTEGARHQEHRIHRYIVNRVREATLASPGYPPTISDLCLQLRVSRRTLNHAFMRVLGITPVAYMRNIRLHRVRAQLQGTPEQVVTIASVAGKWGFWHMSLFSRYYRELFGELPMATLNRARSVRTEGWRQ